MVLAALPGTSASGACARPELVIRRVEEEDLDFLLSVAKRCYPDHEFDPVAARAWLQGNLGQDWVLMLRGRFGGLVATVTRPFYGGKPSGYVVFVATLPNREAEGCRMIRLAALWAKRKFGASLRISEQTDRNFGALARRLGAKECRPAYVLEI